MLLTGVASERRFVGFVVHIFVFLNRLTYLCSMSKVNALYHIVFCTKRREMRIEPGLLEDLYRFIWKEITVTGSRLLRIGGIQNHVHMLIDLHPAVSLAELMRNIKGHSSRWMLSDSRFRLFEGWASEYFASTIAPDDKDAVINYIKGQREHHLGQPFDVELEQLFRIVGLQLDSRDLR